jgi:hypothetical protein
MGLDGVEIVMEVEGEFGIQIPDAAAGRLLTVGDLAAFVIHQKAGRKARFGPDQCPTAAVFYALRRQAIATLDASRRAVRPSACLANLIGWDERRGFWAACAATGIHLPPLRAPPVLRLLVIPVAVVVCLGVALTLGVLAMFVAMFGIVWLWMKMLEPLVCVLPDGCVTVGDLVRQSWVSPSQTTGEQSHDDVIMVRVMDIVAQQMGIPRTRLTPGTRFSDLGI